ncbi:hypothetical protein [Paraclostridium sp. AKS81]|uniref:hypothetical protein n=1 Tax=Paraclostridium sp. AKS81 TaxID=2876117 RepID=UPI0021E016B8|nr:hypothetical protein [Paraclostridium sp. AKS81]MCU9810633.1 hypothetical protein [Paraclostridium sp. AKS81]
MKVKFNIRGVIYGMIVLILLLGGFVFVPKMFMDESKPVDYIMLQKMKFQKRFLI